MSIQVSIKKQDQITNQASFPSREEALAWLAHHESMKSFGQPKQIVQQQIELEPAVIEKQMFLVKEAQLDEEGNEIAPAEYEEQDIVVKEAVFEMQEVELAGEYEVEVTDISSQLAQEAINAEAKQFLNDTDKLVIRHRDQKELGIPTKLSEEEFQALLLERQAARDRVV